MVEIVKGIHVVELVARDLSHDRWFGVESYVLDCDEGVVIVDTGMNEDHIEKIFDEVQNMGKTLGDIKLCIITHKHRDHIGNLPKVREATNARILSHEAEAYDIERAVGITIDRKLNDREILPYCGDIQIVHVPGHTKGNICLYLRKNKLIIAGDTIWDDKEGNLISPPSGPTEDVPMAKREIERLLKYDFDILLMTHGNNILQDAKNEVKKLCQR